MTVQYDPTKILAVHDEPQVLTAIEQVMGSPSLEEIEAFEGRAVAVASGEQLVPGQNNETFASDLFPDTSPDGDIAVCHPGPGVEVKIDGTWVAKHFGYLCVKENQLSVLSPIWVSPDHMTAYFVNLPQTGPQKVPQARDLLKILASIQLTTGIDIGVIEYLCNRQSPPKERCIEIARGRKPERPGGITELGPHILPEATFAKLQKLQQATDIQAANHITTKARPVRAGTVLAEQSIKKQGQATGWNIFGTPLMSDPSPSAHPAIQPGPNVRCKKIDGRICYVSEIYGYAGCHQNQLTVISPLWISPDNMEAHFVALPQGSDPPVLPTPAEIEELLLLAGICHGIDWKASAKICEEHPDPNAPQITRLARGTAPIPGKDGYIETFFARLPAPVEFLEAGKKHFQMRDQVCKVERGSLIARKTPPQLGTPGVDVKGKETQAPEGNAMLLCAGAGVYEKEEAGKQHFYAATSGWARIVNNTLSVMPKTRNREGVIYPRFRVEGDAELSEPLHAKSHIEATGDIYVDGPIKPGSTLAAGGHVVVRGSIWGARVKAGGNLYAISIKNSEVETEGDVEVVETIRDSIVKSQGTLQIHPHEQNRHLIGGQIMAQQGIQAASIGDPEGHLPTRIIAGVVIDGQARVKEYREKIASAEQRALRIFQGLRAQTGDGEQQLLSAIRQQPPEQQKTLMAQWEELQKTLRQIQQIKQHCQHLETQRQKVLSTAQICVTQKIYPGTTVQIGPIQQMIDEEMESVLFRLDIQQERIVRQPV